MTDFITAVNSAPVVLVEFFASWCPHCQRMMPVVDQIQELLDSKVPVYRYDVDEYPDEASSAGAESIPTFIVYKNGNPVWRHSGEIDGNLLLSKIEAQF